MGGFMYFIKRLFFGLIIIIILTAGLFSSSDTYYVHFERNPDLEKGNKVVFKGFDIGEIKEIKLTKNNYIQLKIKINDKYRAKMVEAGIFYGEGDKLKYIILDKEIENKNKVKDYIGFENKYRYYMWKTKNWLKDGIKAIRKKIKENKEKI